MAGARTLPPSGNRPSVGRREAGLLFRVMNMHKHEILTRLHQIVADRLFGREWLADWDACAAVQTSLVKMGLQEEERPNEWRNTSLGKELKVDLFMVFMGLWTASDMPMILEHHGLLDAPEDDWDEIWPIAWSADEEPAEAARLREHVRQIYLKFCNADRGLN
jgi:hypothetical protein